MSMPQASGNDLTGLGNTIKQSIGDLREKTLDMSQTFDTLGKGDAIAEREAVYQGQVEALSPGNTAVGANVAGKPEAMPEASDIDDVLDRYAGMVDEFTKMSYTFSLFTAGTSITTKIDGSVKMFIQAQ